MSGAKKQWITAMASALLVLLLLPCVHAAAHHHDDAVDSVCAAAHTECRDCSAAPCSQKPEVRRPADNSLAIESPVRRVLCVRIFDTYKPLVSSSTLSFSDILPLLTVQLLI
jgi:hypothetical protein